MPERIKGLIPRHMAENTWGWKESEEGGMWMMGLLCWEPACTWSAEWQARVKSHRVNLRWMYISSHEGLWWVWSYIFILYPNWSFRYNIKWLVLNGRRSNKQLLFPFPSAFQTKHNLAFWSCFNQCRRQGLKKQVYFYYLCFIDPRLQIKGEMGMRVSCIMLGIRKIWQRISFLCLPNYITGIEEIANVWSVE